MASYPVYLLITSPDSVTTITYSVNDLSGASLVVGTASAGSETTLSFPTGSYSAVCTQGSNNASVLFSVGTSAANPVVAFQGSADPQPSDSTGVQSLPQPLSTALATAQPDTFEYLYPALSYDRYYTASQVRIYIGDVFLDEASGCQFILQSNKVPVYGYASEIPDAFGRGRSIVQGQLSVNFVSHGYLTAAIQEFYRQSENGEADPDYQQLAAASSTLSTPPPQPAVLNDTSRPGFVQQGGTQAPADALSAARSVALWQQSKSQTQQVQDIQAFRRLLRSASPSTVDRYRASRRQINIGGLRPSVNPAFTRKSFHLLVEIGGGETQLPGQESYRYQRWIRDCRITGNELIVAQDGSVLLDSYSFIARSVDVPAGSPAS